MPTAGSITVAGDEITRLSASKLTAWRARHVGFIFQMYNLIPVLTAFQNVELPLLLTKLCQGRAAQRTSRPRSPLVGLADRMHHYPRQLSGGQEQRVAIARAIVADPTFLLCDEPTGDLDRKSADEILDLLDRLVQRIRQDHPHGHPRPAGRGAGEVDPPPRQGSAGGSRRSAGSDGMKYPAARLGQPAAQEDAHDADHRLLRRGPLPVWAAGGRPHRLQRPDSDVAGRRPPGRDQPGLADPAAARSPTGTAFARIHGVSDVTYASWFGGVYQDERNFFPQFAIDPDTWLDVYSEYIGPAGPARGVCRATARLHGRPEPGQALRVEGRRPNSAPGHHLAGTWEFNVRGHLRRREAGRRYVGHVLPLRLSRRAAALRQRDGRLVRRQARQPRTTPSGSPRRSTRPSPILRTRRRPRPSRPSPPPSSSRWATSSSWC